MDKGGYGRGWIRDGREIGKMEACVSRGGGRGRMEYNLPRTPMHALMIKATCMRASVYTQQHILSQTQTAWLAYQDALQIIQGGN